METSSLSTQSEAQQESFAPKKRGRKPKQEEPEGSVISVYDEMMLELVKKDYVLFAPKSKHGLKHDYPELADKDKTPELVGVREPDVMFAWAWACASSPFVEIEPKGEKLRICCKYAYPEESASRKAKEYSLTFPSEVERAIGKMASYSKEARVEEYVAIRIARENYKHMLAQDISKASVKEQREWAENSIIAQKGLAQQRDRVEGFSLGIEESHNTLMQQAVDLLSMHHSRN